ncbi:hypothetical protein HY008_00565 [Candidatus Woesebacteria bacterium]|nr:hypothetical protein [Candidatus Woesebacteria bacterium]
MSKIRLFLAGFLFLAFAQGETCTPTPGDADNNQIINLQDFNIWLFHYLPVPHNHLDPTHGDFDCSGSTTLQDFNIWLFNYLNPPVFPTVTPSSIPTTPQPVPSGAPYNWGPFDPNKIPVEIEGWWTPQPDNARGYGHIHVLCRWPLSQKVSGVIKTDCRITMHTNPSTFTSLSFYLAPDIFVKTYNLENKKCPYDGITPSVCSWNVPVELDTSNWANGWRHLRINVLTRTVDGRTWTTSSEIPFQVDDSNDPGSIPECTNNCFIAKSWYEGFDYQRVLVKNVPIEKIGGAHTFLVQAYQGTSPKTQRLTVDLDKSHFVPEVKDSTTLAVIWPSEGSSVGDVLLEVENPDANLIYEVTVDTTKLDNGWHAISAKATHEKGGNIDTCPYATGCTNPNFLSGLGKVWFYVEN